MVDDAAPKEDDVTLATNPSKKSDNAVLRKLLRGPRYFDPPDNSWGNCYNCGEGGHTAVNCTSTKRRKPGFVCGSLEHNAKQCNKTSSLYLHIFKLQFSEKKIHIGGKQPSNLSLASVSLLMSEEVPFSGKYFTVSNVCVRLRQNLEF